MMNNKKNNEGDGNDNLIGITYTNIRSLSRQKVPLIKAVMDTNGILILTEVWGGEAYGSWDDFMVTRVKSRQDRKGGGVLISIPKVWDILEEGNVGQDGDDLYVKARVDRDRVIWIVAVYVAPGKVRLLTERLRGLNRLIANIYKQERTPNIILAGDFNQNLLESEGKSIRKEIQNLLSYKIVAHDFGQTCFRTKGGSRIDWVMTSANMSLESKTSIKETAATDHSILRAKTSIPIGRGRNRIVMPNRKLGKELMIAIMQGEESERSITSYLAQLRKNLHRRSLVVRPNPDPTYKASILDIFTRNREMDEVRKELTQMWEITWMNLEKQRFSQESKTAFGMLRKLTKYHMFDKAGGGIASAIIKQDGSIERDCEKVSRAIILSMEKLHTPPQEQRIESRRRWEGLQALTVEETIAIMERMPKNKAVAFDLIGDDLFEVTKDNQGRVTKETAARAKMLSRVWDEELLNSRDAKLLLQGRLIPLNKKFPKTPMVEEVRPIVIMSSLIKFMELRLAPKLSQYMVEKLHRSQVGFVPGMGVDVNIWRLLNQLKSKSKTKPVVVFVDFSSAYNTIYHRRLMEKLRESKILDEDEIRFIEGLYERSEIRLGNHGFQPGRGVMQGSPISPYLFNIYIEELLVILTNKYGLSLEEVLANADDLAVVCYSINLAHEVVNAIIEWSNENGLKVNNNKSGILQICGRNAKPSISMKTVLGIPVVESYRYLGLYLNSKLSVDHHLEKTRKKIEYLAGRLAMIPKANTIRLKANMWHVFIRPYIDVCLLFDPVNSRTQRNKVAKIARMTFKRITGLCVTTSTNVVDLMMNFSTEERSEERVKAAEEKWKARREGKRWEREHQARKAKRDLSRIGMELIRTMNMTKRRCKKCPELMLSIQHLKESHKLLTTREKPEVDIIHLLMANGSKEEIGNQVEEMRREYEKILDYVNELQV